MLNRIKELLKKNTLEKINNGFDFESAVDDSIEEIKHKYLSLKDMDNRSLEFLKDDIYNLIYDK